MPVLPLFVVDMKTLRDRLRLGGISVTSNAFAILEKAVEDVRVFLFDADRGLGEAKVLALRAVTFVENTLLPAELERTKANNLEIMWVRLLLLRRMPLFFMDASAVTHEAWNEEPFTRMSRRDIEAEIKRLEAEILQVIGSLSGVSSAGIDIFVIEPEIAPELPGDSIKPLFLRSES